MEQGRAKLMTRRALLMPALIVAAVLVACVVALLTVSEDAGATFPGKNGRIAYSAFVDGSRGDAIYTIAPRGAGNTRVTGGSYPSYSPDGKRIVYFAYDETSSKRVPDMEIYTINVRGGDKTQLTHNSKDDIGPDYSPDGKRIAYSLYNHNDDLQSDIYTIDASGGGRTRVTNTDNAFVQGPSWESRP